MTKPFLPSSQESAAYNLGLERAASYLEVEIKRLKIIGRPWTKSRISEYQKRCREIRGLKIRD